MAKGNPNPDMSGLKPYKPGQSGNPGGLTSEQAAKRKSNRDKAMAIEEKLLDALTQDMTDRETAILDHVRGDVLRLIHTAIEREDGKPKQAVDLSSEDGTMTTPTTISILPVASKSTESGQGVD